MKRCPNCNRSYTNDQQKFCTQDGTPLVDAVAPKSGQGETIRIDSAQLNATQTNDEPTKVISRELTTPPAAADFDPYKTIINAPHTSASLPRNTQDLTPPPAAPTSQPLPPPPQSTSQPLPPQPTLHSLPPSPSGPIQPPPDQMQSVSPQPSGPITQTPPPSPGFAPVTAATPPRPGKKSKVPLVLGILAVLFLFGVGALGAVYWFVVRPMIEQRRVIVNEIPSPTPTPGRRSTPTPQKEVVKEVPPYSPPANAVQFVNSIDNLDGKLKEHYVDFSFYYPQGWEKDPKAGVPGASNFAKVERRLPPDFTQENFAVGWYSSAGSEEGDRAVFHSLAENLSGQFAKGFTDYKKVSEGPTKAGPYDGYEFRFESMSRNTERGDIKIWGRVIFVPPVDGSKNGATLLMLATSLATELKSVNDVGVKGELPMTLESFRFGK
jgi:hypothetical protein